IKRRFRHYLQWMLILQRGNDVLIQRLQNLLANQWRESGVHWISPPLKRLLCTLIFSVVSFRPERGTSAVEKSYFCEQNNKISPLQNLLRQISPVEMTCTDTCGTR